MPTGEKEIAIERPPITTWSSKEQDIDLVWIEENLPIFKEMALTAYDEQGPGIIIVHTFQQHDEGGHPYGYLPQTIVEEFGKEEITQKVREYDPQSEAIIMLLKSDYRENTYRVDIGQV